MTGRNGFTDLGQRTFVMWGALALTIALANMPNDARAHQDPPLCSGVDVALSLTVTRNNGDPVVGAVTECETLKYQAKLRWTGECLIQSGAFKLRTPDGVDHEIANPVPCLGDATVNAEGCVVGQNTEVASPIIPYTVSPGDDGNDGLVDNQLSATSMWVNGVLHQAPGNVPGQNDDRTIVVTMELCSDGLFCTGLETCDPNATNGVQLGLCQPATPPDCGQSDQCTTRRCDDDVDQCVEEDTSGRCGATDFCVERGCLPETGCFENDNSDVVCPDEFCTERTCNPETSQCDETDVSVTKCGTGDACTDRLCDEVNDVCVDEDTSARCGTGDFCVARGCDPEAGCFETDNSEALCPDEFCTERTCNPETSQCDEVDVSDKCGEGDQCRDRVCDEVNDVCIDEDTSGRCGVGDECANRGCDPATGCFEEDTSGRCGVGDQCTDRGCDPATGCFETDTSGRCDDANLCTTERCDPAQGCVMENEVVCDDRDPCRPLACNPETGQCENGDGTGTPFLIKQTARFGNGSHIGGGLGVNLPRGRLRLGRNVVVVDGAALKGDIVSIGNGTSVDDVYTNQFLMPRDNSAIVNGTVGPIVLPLEEFFCPIPDFTCGGPSVVVPPGGTLGPLDPGSYGPLRMLNGSKLTLKPGTFTFCDFRTGRSVDIRTTGGGTTTINVDGKFRLANGSFMGPDNASLTPVLNVTGRRLRIGAGSTLQAIVSAPDALITLGRGAKLIGTFCACRGRSDKNITLECPPVVESPSGAFLDPID